MSTQKEHHADPENVHGCLSPENLSAALDGEYAFTPEELSHLEHCKRCKDLYESYKLLDDVLSHTLDIKCPASSMKRIQKKVAYSTNRSSSLPEDGKKGFDFVAWSFRVAAMLALFSAAGYLLWKEYTAGKRQPPDSYAQIPLSAPASAGGRAELAPTSSRGGGGRSLSGETAALGSVDIRDLQLISSGTAHPLEFVDSASVQRPAAGSRVETIPKEVHHVWIYDSSLQASAVEKIFRRALKKANLVLNGIKFDLSSDGTLRADLDLSRRQAVLLVRALAGEKLMLLNSAQPQPEQRLFAGTGREAVRYKVLLLSRKAK